MDGKLYLVTSPGERRRDGGSRVEVRPSLVPNAGFGVFALRDFDARDIIVEYGGQRIDRAEADRRAWRGTGDKVRAVTKGHEYVDGATVLPTAADVGSFVNDHETPNAVIETRWDKSIDRDRVFVVATTPIDAGSEVYVPYGRTFWEREWSRRSVTVTVAGSGAVSMSDDTSLGSVTTLDHDTITLLAARIHERYRRVDVSLFHVRLRLGEERWGYAKGTEIVVDENDLVERVQLGRDDELRMIGSCEQAPIVIGADRETAERFTVSKKETRAKRSRREDGVSAFNVSEWSSRLATDGFFVESDVVPGSVIASLREIAASCSFENIFNARARHISQAGNDGKRWQGRFEEHVEFIGEIRGALKQREIIDPTAKVLESVMLKSLAGCADQAAHRDLPPRNDAAPDIVVMVAVDAFDVLVCEGSHREFRDEYALRRVHVPAGSMVLFDARLVHAGAASDVEALRAHFVVGLRKIENDTFAP